MIRTAEGTELTNMIMAVFKLHGLLILTGDDLVRELGLSSARWKVLGALGMAKKPLTVSGIAHSMGQTRQAVQRLANEMVKDNLLFFQENPRHKKAKLLCLTDQGRIAFEKAEQKQIDWVNTLANDMGAQSLGGATVMLGKLIRKLERC